MRKIKRSTKARPSAKRTALRPRTVRERIPQRKAPRVEDVGAPMARLPEVDSIRRRRRRLTIPDIEIEE